MKNNKYGMPPPSTRSEFEHNIFMSVEIALHKIKNEQFDPYFVSRTIPQLQKLIYTPNGRIEFNSVDEQLRLNSNMMHWMELMPPPEKKIKEEENE